MMNYNVKEIFRLVDKYAARPWWKRWLDWLRFRAWILWLDIRDYCARRFKR